MANEFLCIKSYGFRTLLNETVQSPWYGLIKELGVGKGTITQATFITALDKYKILTGVLKDYSLEQKYRIISNYFNAIKDVYGQKWGASDSMVSKSLCLHAFLKNFPRVFSSLMEDKARFRVTDIVTLISPIKRVRIDSKRTSSLGGMKGADELAGIFTTKIFGGN